jgi:hypothetical protein
VAVVLASAGRITSGDDRQLLSGGQDTKRRAGTTHHRTRTEHAEGNLTGEPQTCRSKRGDELLGKDPVPITMEWWTLSKCSAITARTPSRMPLPRQCCGASMASLPGAHCPITFSSHRYKNMGHTTRTRDQRTSGSGSDGPQREARALGGPTRHQIFRHTADARRSENSVRPTALLFLNQYAVCQHLTVSEDARLVVEEIGQRSRHGRPLLLYRLRPDASRPHPPRGVLAPSGGHLGNTSSRMSA